jgi:hypothetical protein
MRFFSRLRTGLALARGSISVLRAHPHLLWFPVVGGLAGLAFLGTLIGSVVLFADVEGSPVLYGALFVAYVGETFLASFVTAGLMHATREAFHGETPTVRGGLAAAWEHKWQLLTWAVVAAVVGVVIRAIEESSDVAGTVVAAVFGLAWAVITYFVVPVIIFEDASVRGTFSRSGALVKEVWGESLGSEAGVGLVTVLLVLLGVGVTALAFIVLPTGTTAGLLVVLAIGAVAIVGALLVGETLSGIARTAVYVYATEDESPASFSHVDFGR